MAKRMSTCRVQRALGAKMSNVLFLKISISLPPLPTEGIGTEQIGFFSGNGGEGGLKEHMKLDLNISRGVEREESLLWGELHKKKLSN